MSFSPEVYRRDRPDVPPFRDITMQDTVSPVVGLGVDLFGHDGEVFIAEAHAIKVGLCMGMITPEAVAILNNRIAELESTVRMFKERNATLVQRINSAFDDFANPDSDSFPDLHVEDIGTEDSSGGEGDAEVPDSEESGAGTEAPEVQRTSNGDGEGGKPEGKKPVGKSSGVKKSSGVSASSDSDPDFAGIL